MHLVISFVIHHLVIFFIILLLSPFMPKDIYIFGVHLVLGYFSLVYGLLFSSAPMDQLYSCLLSLVSFSTAMLLFSPFVVGFSL